MLYGPLWNDKNTLFIEMVAIADTKTYRHFRYDHSAIESHIKEVVFVANAYLNKIGVVLVLSGIRVWTSDEIRMGPDLSGILNQLSEYRPRFLKEEPDLPNDNLVIFTREENLRGLAAGKAFTRGICKDNHGSAVVRDRDNKGVLGRIVAHELGHNLGFNHDNEEPNCLCHGGECIMHPQSVPEHMPEHTWSECSRHALTRARRRDRVDCLRNLPEKFIGGCGDGVVQEALGEQCDCGPPEFCHNKCCDPNTCRLVNATCATGSCCDTETCTPKPPGEVCRATFNECDLPEYCSGHSEACPVDTYKIDGANCNGGEGRCYKGSCSSHDLRCQYVYGSSSVSAHDRCYDELNLRGNGGGNCGWTRGTKDLKTCGPGSIRCGTLHCVPQSTPEHRFSKHFYNETVSLDGNPCTSITASEYYPSSYWLVPDGASCGDGKMCINQECRSVDVAMGDCAGGCSGHGVCNSLHHCHCDPGYAPPDCSTKGFGGSIDSNITMDYSDFSHWIRAAWIVPVLLVGVLCVVCCLWGYLHKWWKQKGHTATSDVLPCCAACLDSCCCPVMTTSTKWLMAVGSKRARKKRSVRSVEAEEGANEAMICSIDVDVKGSQETNSWGVANEKLVTEVVTITPKNSPDLRRKVQLPSNSPVLHRKSVNDLDRPKYMQSISVDSGCGSDTDDGGSSKRSSLHMSMSSLISAFMKFNPKSSKTPPENENRKSRNFGSQKSMPLSRFVVDPLAGSRSSRQGTPPPDHIRPAYNRSFSSDAHLGNKGRPGGVPPPPPPANTKPHKSEENLLKTAAVSKNVFLQEDKENFHSSESLAKKPPPVIPPSTAKPKVPPSQAPNPPKISPPRSIPLHGNKSNKKEAPMPPKKKPAGGPGTTSDGRHNEKRENSWKGATKDPLGTGTQRGMRGSGTEDNRASQRKNVMDIAKKFEAL